MAEQGHNLAFLHAGDTFQGTGYFVLNLGVANRNVLNQMNVDGMVVGNHEFDKLRAMNVTTNESGGIVIKPGSSQPLGYALSNFTANVNFPVFAANVVRTNDAYLGPLTNMIDCRIMEIDGMQVGVFGITLENMDSISSPSSDLQFLPEIATASNMVKQLEAAGVNKIVMISHVGYNKDQAIAAAVPGIDVVIGGHSHSYLGDFSAFDIISEGDYPTIVTNTAGGKSYVLTAGQHALDVGLCEVTFDESGVVSACRGSDTLLLEPPTNGTPVDKAGTDPAAELEAALSSSGNYVWIDEDASLRAYIASNYTPALENAYGEVIAQVPYALLHERVPTDPEGHGSDVGPVVCEALATATNYGSHIDFCIENAGGIRTDIPAGVYRENQSLMELMIFGNSMSTFDLTGAQTKEILSSVIKHAIQNPDNDGCFPYTGRLRYTVYPNFEFQSVDIYDGTNWAAIVDDQVYRAAANSYIAGGSDNYTLLKQYAANVTNHSDLIDNALFTEYVRALGAADKPLVKMPYETTTVITGMTQSITFTDTLEAAYAVGVTIDLTATASSGLDVTYSVSDTTVATNCGSTLYITGAGTCDVVAVQAGNTNYYPAVNVTQSLTVTPIALTVSGVTANNKLYDGTTAATLDASSAAFTGVINADDVAIAANPTGTFASAAVGTNIAVTSHMTLSGAQAKNYTLTQPTDLTADITKGTQIITFPIADKVYWQRILKLSATANSGLAVTYAVTDGPAAITNDTYVSFSNTGTVTIAATQAGDDSWNPMTNSVTFEATKTRTLYLSHVNDTHSNFDPQEVPWRSPLETNVVGMVAGGYPRVKKQVDIWSEALKAIDHELVFLHAGDTFQGTGYFVLNLGVANRNVLNQMNVDGMVVGNHEFDKLRAMNVSTNESGEIVITPGSSQPKGYALSNFTANVNFPVYAANVVRTNDPYLGPLTNMIDCRVMDVDGMKVGVFGITLGNMASIASPSSDLQFLPEIATASNMVKQLENAGVSNIVMISHVGYTKDQAIAAAVPGIDVVIGGHSHSYLGDFSSFEIISEGDYPTIVTNTAGGKAYVLQAGQHALDVGLCEVTFDEDGVVTACRGSDTLLLAPPTNGTPVEKAGTDPAAELEAALSSKGNYVWIDEDADLRAYIASNYTPALENAYGGVIAQVPVAMLHERVPTDPEGHGSDVAPRVCEALAVATNYGSHIDFSLQNAGGIRTDIPCGEYRENQTLMELMIFGNSMSSFDLTGAQTKEILSYVIGYALAHPDNDGCFPYTGRLRYTYNRADSSLSNVDIYDGSTWTALVDTQVYRVVANSYIAGGQDNYTLLAQYAANMVNHSNLIDNAVFTEYVKALGAADQPLVKMPYETTTVRTGMTQTITFDQALNAVYAESAEITLTATASSGLDVTYASLNTAVATNSGTKLYITGAGNCPVVASQVGNTNYYPAANVTNVLTVTPKALTVTRVVVNDKTYDGNMAATLAATGLDGVINNDSVQLANNTTGTFETATAGVDKPVTSYMTLSGAQAGYYSLTQPTNLTATIFKADQTITFTVRTNVCWKRELKLTGSASSGLAVTYAVTDGANIATLTNTTSVMFSSTGSVTIVASQFGDINYNAASNVPATFNATDRCGGALSAIMLLLGEDE